MTLTPHVSRILLLLGLLYPSDAFMGPKVLGWLEGSSRSAPGRIASSSTTKQSVHATILAPFSTQPPFDVSEYRSDITNNKNHYYSTISSEIIPSENGQQQESKKRDNSRNEDDDKGSNYKDSLETLCRLLGASPTDLLQFQSTTEDGVRGVYLKREVKKDEVILNLPLSSCLQDSLPPSWMTWKDEEEEDRSDEGDDSEGYYHHHHHSIDWVTRLAASLLDLQLSSNANEGQSLWLSLLPNAEYLRASLPVHWSEEIVESARSTSFELAVDSAYFGRAEAVEDLMTALKSNSGLISGDVDDIRLRRLCHNALDIIQTRSCRLNMDDDDETSPPVRVLAPIFDFINHGSIQVKGDTGANAQFQREGDSLVVRAIMDINANEEILIDYGESARPAWRCLLSYGFVPQYTRIPGPHEDAIVDSHEEDNEAEVFIDGTRYIVGPSQIPYDMVTAAALSDNDNPNTRNDDDEVPVDREISLTPDIALKLAKRISDVAFYLLLEQEQQLSDDCDDDNDDNDRDPGVVTATTALDIISRREAAALRWSQHRVLLACALGLREYADENQ